MKRLMLFLATAAMILCSCETPEPDDSQRSAREAENIIESTKDRYEWEPYANFSYNVIGNKKVTFRDLSMGVKMLYEFGDMSDALVLYPPTGQTKLTSEDKVFTHKFPEKGDYFVSVTTWNDKGTPRSHFEWVNVK